MIRFNGFLPEAGQLTDGEISLVLERTVGWNDSSGLAPTYHFGICKHLDDYHIDRVGFCDLRIGYGMELFYGGNIGYTVLAPFNGHHYAEKACRLLFRLAQLHNMDELIITCNPDNLPSKRTCERLGGELLGVFDLPEGNEMRLRGETQKCVFQYKL